jgi:hypothetical protein
MVNPLNDDLANDLLEGADEIAAFMGWNRRRVFYAAERKLIPIFRVGNRLSARKSSLRRRIEDLEQRATEEAEESPSG